MCEAKEFMCQAKYLIEYLYNNDTRINTNLDALLPAILRFYTLFNLYSWAKVITLSLWFKKILLTDLDMNCISL